MKNTSLLLIFVIGLFLGCTTEKREIISFNDFDRLIKADSIQSLQVYNDEQAVITKRSTSSNSEKLVLLITSSDDFREMLNNRYAKNRVRSVSFIHNGRANLAIMELIPIVLIIGILVLFLIAAIDILKNKFGSDIEKLIWILVVIFVPLLGPILYLLIGKKQKLNFEK